MSVIEASYCGEFHSFSATRELKYFIYQFICDPEKLNYNCCASCNSAHMKVRVIESENSDARLNPMEPSLLLSEFGHRHNSLFLLRKANQWKKSEVTVFENRRQKGPTDRVGEECVVCKRHSV